VQQGHFEGEKSMEHLLDFGARRFASELPGLPEPVEGGVLIPPGRVSILHRMPGADVYRHGWNSWSPCGWRAMGDPPLRIAAARRRLTADDPVWDEERRHHSAGVAALADPDGNVLLLGALGLDVPRIAIDRDTLTAWYESSNAPWFCAYGPELEVFARYAAMLGDRLGRRANSPGPVWCSWYSYYENIDEVTLGKDADDLAAVPFSVFQVDDGWQRAVGDWHPNARFASGMDQLAARVSAAGKMPGLWVAPFIAVPSADIVRDRPDLFLRDERGCLVPAGYNWGGPYYALDLTLPEAQDHVASLIRRVTGWGFRYLKLDFVNAGAVSAWRHDPDTGRETVYRNAMRLIREVVGEDVYLLGSGAPVLASLGILDGIRVGPDAGPMWSHYATDDPSDATAQNALVTSVNRLWLAGLCDLDPDAVYFRSRANLLSTPQRQLLISLAYACGFRCTSDPWSWLSETERQAMAEFARSGLPAERVGRYRVRVDGHVVDFTRAASRELV
jgi:alpha-galactosidase